MVSVFSDSFKCSFYSWCCIHCVFVLGEHCKCACMLCGLCIVWGVCVYACFFAWGHVCVFVVWRWVCVWRLYVVGAIFCVLCFVGLVLRCFTWSLLSLFWLLIYGWELFIPIKIFLFIPLFLCFVFSLFLNSLHLSVVAFENVVLPFFLF